MEEEPISGEKRTQDPDRNTDGTFRKGNRFAKFPKEMSLKHLTKMIREDEKIHPGKETLLEHYKNRLKKNDNLLGKFMDKYLPSIVNNQITGAGGTPLNLIIKLAYPEEEKK
jgi:hypothetical protein